MFLRASKKWPVSFRVLPRLLRDIARSGRNASGFAVAAAIYRALETAPSTKAFARSWRVNREENP